MKSGLEGRNNLSNTVPMTTATISVSMKSGLEGRNNLWKFRALLLAAGSQ